MKQKIKEISKKYLVGFIIGSIIFGAAGVYAVTYFPSINTTYDNTKSGMTSTNVQDAVDELYEVCTPPKTSGEQILEDQLLEKDEYECRYFFTGENPNNYITFNNETAGWRIISVECDGRIKIMRPCITTIELWDERGSNNWARPATLNTYLNETYYNGLNNAAKNQIVASNFSIGAVINDNNNMSTQVNDENSSKWNGKIALPTVSEYIRTNSNKSSCGTFNLINNNYSSCANTGWMDGREFSGWVYWLSLTPVSGSTNQVYVVHEFIHYLTSLDPDPWVNPALYLSSDIKITGGTGTQSDPYEISL